MEHVGIDLHTNTSQICIITESGDRIERGIRTTRERFVAVFGGRPRALIVIEASTESEWVARCLEDLGHEVVVADPNFSPMYLTRTRRVKTDRRDARALAEACRLRAYRPAHRCSDNARHIRGVLAVRDALVRTRSRYISLIRALLRGHGFRVRSGGSGSLVARISELELPEQLHDQIAPSLAIMEPLNNQILECDRMLDDLVTDDERMNRLCSVPGVGPVTAAAFVAVVDDVGRFRSAHQLEAYLGLVPRESSSAERQQKGRITKLGNSRVRWLLVQAAWVILRRPRPETEALREWAARIAARRGARVAVVALARRLAGILYAMTRDSTSYDPQLLGKGKRARVAA